MKNLTSILNKMAKSQHGPDARREGGVCLTTSYDYKHCNWRPLSCRDVEKRSECREGPSGDNFVLFRPHPCECSEIEGGRVNECHFFRDEVPPAPLGESLGVCCTKIQVTKDSSITDCDDNVSSCQCDKYRRWVRENGFRVTSTFTPNKNCNEVQCGDGGRSIGACCKHGKNEDCVCNDMPFSYCIGTGGSFYPHQKCKDLFDVKTCCFPVT